MKRARIGWIVFVTVAIVTGGGAWLWATQDSQPASQAKAPPPTNPTIPAPTITPNVIAVNTPTEVVATVSIPDPTLNPSSVQLLRLNADGGTSVVAQMEDKGQGGDRRPGDRVFTASFTMNELVSGHIQLAVLGVFRGQNAAISAASYVAVWQVISHPGLGITLTLPPDFASTQEDRLSNEIAFSIPPHASENDVLLSVRALPLSPSSSLRSWFESVYGPLSGTLETEHINDHEYIKWYEPGMGDGVWSYATIIHANRVVIVSAMTRAFVVHPSFRMILGAVH
jgi:hypothetical protein